MTRRDRAPLAAARAVSSGPVVAVVVEPAGDGTVYDANRRAVALLSEVVSTVYAADLISAGLRRTSRGALLTFEFRSDWTDADIAELARGLWTGSELPAAGGAS
jgi:acetylornithine/succinyldiaminopimelate/putrescine aminotransferase